MKASEKELERILKALANRRRINILKYLKRTHKAAVGEIAEAIRLSFKATSKHLMILANADVVEKEQVGLLMLYFLPKAGDPITSKLLSIL